VKIEDIKEVAEIFKYVKTLSPMINKFGEIRIKGNNGKAVIYFDSSPFYILSGELLEDNKLTSWLKDKQTKLSLEDLKRLSKVLKKSMKEVEYDDEKFSFVFTEDDVDFTISLVNEQFDIPEETKIKNIDEKLSNELSVGPEEFTKNVFQIFEKDGKFTTEESEDKIFEMPSKKILSLVKQHGNATIKFSNLENEFRYISISTENELVKFTEIFAVI